MLINQTGLSNVVGSFNHVMNLLKNSDYFLKFEHSLLMSGGYF